MKHGQETFERIQTNHGFIEPIHIHGERHPIYERKSSAYLDSCLKLQEILAKGSLAKLVDGKLNAVVLAPRANSVRQRSTDVGDDSAAIVNTRRSFGLFGIDLRGETKIHHFCVMLRIGFLCVRDD